MFLSMFNAAREPVGCIWHNANNTAGPDSLLAVEIAACAALQQVARQDDAIFLEHLWHFVATGSSH